MNFSNSWKCKHENQISEWPIWRDFVNRKIHIDASSGWHIITLSTDFSFHWITDWTYRERSYSGIHSLLTLWRSYSGFKEKQKNNKFITIDCQIRDKIASVLSVCKSIDSVVIQLSNLILTISWIIWIATS